MDERELDLLVADLEQENRLLRARNERLLSEMEALEEKLDAFEKAAKASPDPQWQQNFKAGWQAAMEFVNRNGGW